MSDLRDRYLAAVRGDALEARDLESLRAELDAAPDAPLLTLEGLPLAAQPSARFQAIRHVDRQAIPEPLRGAFLRAQAPPGHAIAFADALALSYRTFEDILPLDRLLERAPLQIALGPPERPLPIDGLWRLAADADPATAAALAGLDDLGLYQAPLNAGSRGGRRFIFHSAALSAALTAAVRQALPAHEIAGFSHVNPVFRCNRFDPGDAPFQAHRDAPYSDPERGHVSRYTLLLYLTGGRGEPALQVAGRDLAEIPAMSCVIFEQRHPHAGAPYLEGRKVFLRSELVFEAPETEHDPAIGALFARACYLTGESLVFPELGGWVHRCFDRVAAAHRAGLDADGQAPEPTLHKVFAGSRFLTNGYDYWFPPGTPLTTCAALAVLDYFNCSIDGAPFRTRCDVELLHRPPGGAWVPGFFAALGPPDGEPPIAGLDPALLMPPPETGDDADDCCPRHTSHLDPARSPEVIRLYDKARDLAAPAIAGAPILLMGQAVCLNPERFSIRDGRITIASERPLRPVHFAARSACWEEIGEVPADYIDVDVALGAPWMLLPPILYRERAGCPHLMFDFFRNDWMVRWEERALPVPRIRTRGEGDPPDEVDSPWARAAERLLRDAGEDPEDWGQWPSNW